MNFLVHHNKTSAALKSWSAPKPLLVASCFFWLAGTDLQKSRHGMIRSLLYDLLEQSPSLIPKVCPQKWKASELNGAESVEQWTTSDLEDTLKRLVEATTESHCLAFFLSMDSMNSMAHFKITATLFNY